MASRFKGVLLGLSLLAGCGPEQTTTEPGTEPKSGVLTLGALSPAEVLPGTVLRLSGTGFPATVGTGDKTQLRLTLTGKGQRAGVPYDVKVDLPAKQQSATLLTVEISDEPVTNATRVEIINDAATVSIGDADGWKPQVRGER